METTNSVCRWFRRTHKSTSEKSYSFCLLHHFSLFSFSFGIRFVSTRKQNSGNWKQNTGIERKHTSIAGKSILQLQVASQVVFKINLKCYFERKSVLVVAKIYYDESYSKTTQNLNTEKNAWNKKQKKHTQIIWKTYVNRFF